MQTSEADRVSKKRRFDSLDYNPPPAPVEKMDVDIPSLPGFTPRM